MKNIAKSLLTVVLALTAILSLTNCSSDDDEASTSVYQGAGSRWTAAFTGGNFVLSHFDEATDTTADMVINGTYVDYSTGFRFMTVTSATGTGAPAAGSEAYGFEVPGFAFFLKPVDGGEEPLVMVNGTSCPTADFNANWVIASYDSSVTLDATKDVFGFASFVFDGASSTATIDQLEPEAATNIGQNTSTFDSAGCSNGVLTFSPGGGETVDMFFTANGGALVHSYDGATHDNIIFAAPKASAAVTQAALAETYSVLVFDDNGGAGDKLFPGKLVIPASGAASFQEIDNVETDTLTGPAIPVTAFTAVGASPGLFTAAIDAGGADGRMSCTFIPFSGTKVIACTGYADDGVRTAPFFLLGKNR